MTRCDGWNGPDPCELAAEWLVKGATVADEFIRYERRVCGEHVVPALAEMIDFGVASAKVTAVLE
jgi:hypothetical protein